MPITVTVTIHPISPPDEKTPAKLTIKNNCAAKVRAFVCRQDTVSMHVLDPKSKTDLRKIGDGNPQIIVAAIGCAKLIRGLSQGAKTIRLMNGRHYTAEIT